MNSVFNIQALRSQQDHSMNFVLPNGLEARFVHRPDTDYFIVYLSSHRGCNVACRFCHLTQTKQVDMTPASFEEYSRQIQMVLSHYTNQIVNEQLKSLSKVHFNWMARGEPLLNHQVQREWRRLNRLCSDSARKVGINKVEFNVSSIIPNVEDPLGGLYGHSFPPRIFYSLYSVNPEFRKRWLPKAMDPERAVKCLKEYQEHSDQWYNRQTDIVLHWAFIEGQNDSKEDVDRILDLIDRSGLNTRFNLVRYNPYSEVQGRESSEEVIQARFEQISAVMRLPGSRIVPRVGFDVAASCGMFVRI